METKSRVSKRSTAKRNTKDTVQKNSPAGRKKATTAAPSRNTLSPKVREEAATRLGEMARDVAGMAEVLGSHSAVTGNDPDVPREDVPDRVPAATVRRLELLAVLLDNQTREFGGQAPVAAAPVVPRNSLAFSWVPDVNVDNNSVSVGIPGVGEVSIGSDGASASVDGVGGASVNGGGVSVNAGGAGVTVDGNGATVTMPGAGTVSVGTDGSVSVGTPTGGSGGPGLPFPNLPMPSFCTNELKIPIPVPKFVVEPFEIPVSVPRLDATPFPIAIPAPELAPMPFNIPYPDVDFNLGSPHLGDLGSFDPIMDVAMAEMLQNIMNGMNASFKATIKQLRDLDDAAGNPDEARIIKMGQIVETIAPMLPLISDAYENLRTHIIQSPIAVTGALMAGWQQIQTLAASLLRRMEKLLKAVPGIDSPVDGIVAIVRTIYLVIGWILARVVRGALKINNALSSLLLQVGARLQAMA